MFSMKKFPVVDEYPNWAPDNFVDFAESLFCTNLIFKVGFLIS